MLTYPICWIFLQQWKTIHDYIEIIFLASLTQYLFKWFSFFHLLPNPPLEVRETILINFLTLNGFSQAICFPVTCWKNQQKDKNTTNWNADSYDRIMFVQNRRKYIGKLPLNFWLWSKIFMNEIIEIIFPWNVFLLFHFSRAKWIILRDFQFWEKISIFCRIKL